MSREYNMTEVTGGPILSKFGHSAKWTLYYDGRCGFCAGARRWLSRMDFLHSIEWTPYQSLNQPPRGLSWEDLDRYAWMDTGRGRLQEGFPCHEAAGAQAATSPSLRRPDVAAGDGHLAGEAAYGWVARNRYRFSRCPVNGGRRV